MHFYHSHDDCGKMTSIPYRLGIYIYYSLLVTLT